MLTQEQQSAVRWVRNGPTAQERQRRIEEVAERYPELKRLLELLETVTNKVQELDNTHKGA